MKVSLRGSRAQPRRARNGRLRLKAGLLASRGRAEADQACDDAGGWHGRPCSLGESLPKLGVALRTTPPLAAQPTNVTQTDPQGVEQLALVDDELAMVNSR